MWQTAFIAGKLHLTTSDFRAIQSTSRNKLVMRNLLNKDHKHIVPFMKLQDIRSQMTQVEQIGFPNITKPAGGASSILVFKNTSFQSLEANLKKIKEGIRANRALYKPKEKTPYVLNLFGDKASQQVIMEKYIPGKEMSVEGFVAHGKVYILGGHDKPEINGEYEFFDNIYSTPSQVLSSYNRAIAHVVRKAVKHIGLTTSPFHVEMKVQKGRPLIVEIGARFGGGPLVENIESAYGFNLHDMYLKYLLEGVLPKRVAPKMASTFVMFQVLKAGKLKSLPSVVTYLKRFPEVKEIKFYVRPGEPIRNAKTGMQYLGHAILHSSKCS